MTVTVAEVAGITVTASNIPNAAPGGIANFEFTITNVGNDPLNFLFQAPSAITGGTAAPLKLLATTLMDLEPLQQLI